MRSTRRPAFSDSVFGAVPDAGRLPLVHRTASELLAAGIATSNEEVAELLDDAVWIARLAASLRDVPLLDEDAAWPPPWDDEVPA